MEYTKEDFLELFYNIERDGAENLLNWLERTDFFEAPASTNFHSNYKGGLLDHTIKVYKRFIKLLESEYGENWQERFSLESATICALLHDVCKVNFYKEDVKNVKVDGQWIQKPYFTVDDALPYGHGEKSVYIINGFIRLTREEAMVINWHMGEYDVRVKGGYALKNVFYKYPIALLFHMADVQATYLDETVE